MKREHDSNSLQPGRKKRLKKGEQNNKKLEKTKNGKNMFFDGVKKTQ